MYFINPLSSKADFEKKHFIFWNIIIETSDFKSYFYHRNNIWLIRKYYPSYVAIFNEIMKTIIELFFIKIDKKRVMSNIKAIKDGLS